MVLYNLISKINWVWMCRFLKFWYKYCWYSFSLNFVHEKKVIQSIYWYALKALFCTKSSLMCENLSLPKIMLMACFCRLWIFFCLFLSYLPISNWHNLRMCQYRYSIMTRNFRYLNNSLALYDIPIFLEILFTVYLMWSFQERSLSNNAPRNLIDGTLSIL